MKIRTPRLGTDTRALQALQDQRLILRWIYLGRMAVATSILLAALLVWRDGRESTVAVLAFVAALVFTALSLIGSELRGRVPASWFLWLQTGFDLLLVTVIVDATGEGGSAFAALYIVVIAVASLILPPVGGLLAALFGIMLYAGDVILRSGAQISTTALLQLVVIAFVALFSRYVSAHLSQARAGSAELAEQLEHLKLQAADVLRSIRSGIITIDATGRLIHANPAASRLLAIELDPYLDRPILSRIHEVSPDLSEMLARTVKRPTRINRGEGEMLFGERRIPIGVTTTYTETRDGIPNSATAIFQDISESKRNELLNLRAERLAAVAELSASLAHEIKNPLASIRSAVEQLARVEYAGEDERLLAALIERESDRLSRLLSEFLDFARVHASQLRMLDVNVIVRDACRLASSHPGPAGARIALQLDDRPHFVEGDEDLLHRAVFNLVLNALQATAQGGSVSVTVRGAHADSESVQAPPEMSGELAEIVVEDTGPGIPPEVRARMFDPFFTTKSGGTGLGLSVVHRAVTSHRGVVLVDSAGKGTRFTVLLPQSQVAQGDAA